MNKNKKKAMNIVKWTTFGFMTLMGLLSFFVGSDSGALLYLITGFFASPMSGKLFKNRKTRMKPGVAFFVGFLLFCSSSGIMLTSAGTDTSGTVWNESILPAEVVSALLNTEISQPQSREATGSETLSAEHEYLQENETSEELNIHFIDVGQGDATLITIGTHAMLIDAGDNDKGTAVQLYLEKRGIGDEVTLDYVIGTHADADHAGGLDVIITKFDIGTVLLSDYAKDTKTYQDVLAAISYRNYKKTAPVAGDAYSLGEAEFTVIAPNNNSYFDANNSSVGILLEHGNNRFLFSGDAEQEAEADILNNGIDIGNIDVYKAGHHGSSTSSSGAFLSEMNPEFVVISLGEDNPYGHPHAEVLNRFRSTGIKVFRTDEQGSIIAASNGDTITWNCRPTESWKAGEATGSDSNSSISEYNEKSVSQRNDNTEVNDESVVPDTDDGMIVHITKTGECYHASGCGSLSRSDIEVTLEEAKAKGLWACKSCNPLQ